MSYHSRQILTPGASGKRKDWETLHSINPLTPETASPTTTTSFKGGESASSNRLLAGYMAYEFLTRGTLLGQEFDPTRVEALPLTAPESMRTKPGSNNGCESGSESGGMKKPKNQSYAEVASLLNGDGAHIPGIVNPTQLDRWIRM